MKKIFDKSLNKEKIVHKIATTMHVRMRCKCQHPRKLKLKCPLRIYGSEQGSWRVRLTWSWCRSARSQRVMAAATQQSAPTLRVCLYSLGTKCEPILPSLNTFLMPYTPTSRSHSIIFSLPSLPQSFSGFISRPHSLIQSCQTTLSPHLFSPPEMASTV